MKLLWEFSSQTDTLSDLQVKVISHSFTWRDKNSPSQRSSQRMSKVSPKSQGVITSSQVKLTQEVMI